MSDEEIFEKTASTNSANSLSGDTNVPASSSAVSSPAAAENTTTNTRLVLNESELISYTHKLKLKLFKEFRGNYDTLKKRICMALNHKNH